LTPRHLSRLLGIRVHPVSPILSRRFNLLLAR
jgi:hypothetical protein